MLNFNLQDRQINEKCINKLATCFTFTPGSHGQCVVKPHTAQSLYQILINYDPCQCLRKRRWLPESGIPPIPLGVKVKVVFLNFLVSIESLFHISEFTDDPCHPWLCTRQGRQASYQKLCRLPKISANNCPAELAMTNRFFGCRVRLWTLTCSLSAQLCSVSLALICQLNSHVLAQLHISAHCHLSSCQLNSTCQGQVAGT